MYQMKRQLQYKYLRLNFVLEPSMSRNNKLVFFEELHECVTYSVGISKGASYLLCILIQIRLALV